MDEWRLVRLDADEWRLDADESRQKCAAKLRLFTEIAKIVDNILFFQAIFFYILHHLSTIITISPHDCIMCTRVVQSRREIVLCVRRWYILAARLDHVYIGSTISLQDGTMCTRVVQSHSTIGSCVHG